MHIERLSGATARSEITSSITLTSERGFVSDGEGRRVKLVPKSPSPEHEQEFSICFD